MLCTKPSCRGGRPWSRVCEPSRDQNGAKVNHLANTHPHSSINRNRNSDNASEIAKISCINVNWGLTFSHTVIKGSYKRSTDDYQSGLWSSLCCKYLCSATWCPGHGVEFSSNYCTFPPGNIYILFGYMDKTYQNNCLSHIYIHCYWVKLYV